MVAHVGVISLGSCFPPLPRLPRLYSTKHKPFSMAVMSEDPVREWILTEGKATQITKISPVGGGCIHLASRYETDAGSFFVKTNRSIGSSMFEAEALGLGAMYETGSIRVPRPFKSVLGRKLAEMHKAGKSKKGFGFDVNNTIGSTPQINTGHQIGFIFMGSIDWVTS
ncbi:hypothetical protein I3760_01G022600 [Carya illinoinensis]|nr:hypothetical protein I3760_01G022600 [Carya illinoinensis]